jgi:hypothetical protein
MATDLICDPSNDQINFVRIRLILGKKKELSDFLSMILKY